MLTKAWQCPSCGREFIVARDAERDTCPWCKTTVQERAGSLEKAPGVPPPPGPSSGGSPGVNPGVQSGANPNVPPGPTPNVPPGPHAGSPAGGPQSAASPQPPVGGRTSGEMWWPYEYDPF